MSREEIESDLAEFGVEEVLEGYMMNQDAIDVISAYIKKLEKENQRLQTQIPKCTCHKISLITHKQTNKRKNKGNP